MKRKSVRISIATICFAAVIYIAFTTYSLMTLDIENLIVCSLYPETNHFPSGVPEFFLLNLRGNKDDIDILNKSKGISFILSNKEISSEKALKYALLFLQKGVNINMIGFDGLTALHCAVLDNQPKYVSFLLENGADINIGVSFSNAFGKKEVTKMHGMNAIELAEFISLKDGQDRSAIIKMLKKKNNTLP